MKDLFDEYVEKANTLQNAVYQTLRELILKQEIIHGFTENEISKQLNISRTPVREAMKRLQTENLIEIFHGRKAQINYIEKKDSENIRLILQRLHGLSVELCIKNIEDHEVDELEEIIGLIHFYTGRKEYAKILEYNTKFHLKICEFANNKWLYNIMKNLMELTYPEREKSINRTQRLVESKNEHTEIFQAIKNRDEQKAIDLMNKHIDHFKESSKRRD